LDGAIHGSPDSPYAHLQPGADLVAMASLSDNVVDAYRCIAPHVRPGDEVLVIGSASIGLYAVAVAGALGAPYTYVDSVDARLRVAERLGAKVISSVPDGKSFGEFAVTASCNSTPGGLQSAIRSTAGGGICQAAGIHFRPVDLPLVEMYRRGIRLETGRASARDQLPAVLDLIQQKRLRPGEIGATVIDVADAPKALRGPLSHKTIIKMV
jgi:threonine dehydrogenase-like Zn-dependent dehydrogenase